MNDYRNIINEIKNALIEDITNINEYQKLLFIIYNNYTLLENENKELNDCLTQAINEIINHYQREKNSGKITTKNKYSFKDLSDNRVSDLSTISYIIKQSAARKYPRR